MAKVYVDVESCGLHGFPVLIQYAYDDDDIQLYSPWLEPIDKTLKLIEDFLFCDGIVGFNLAFDFFHLCKTYTVFSLIKDKKSIPINLINEIAELEPLGRDGPCLKPRSACDLMLHARKGPYQSTMDRGDIRIRRVPTPLAWQLATELEKRIPLSDIYFARRKDKTRAKWDVTDIEDADGDIHPDFKDIVLRFAPSSALKALAIDALGVTEDSILLFTDVEVDHKLRPVELGYAPFAKAIGTTNNWKSAWPDVIKHHINHWRYNTLARTYAAKDVEYTRALYEYFGSPELGDNDSILACMVAAVRWKGFAVDIEGMKELKRKTLFAQTKMVNGREFRIPTAPEKARYYVQELMDETERLCAAKDGFDISTGKVLLQDIAEWKKDCPTCNGEGVSPAGNCTTCEGTGEVRHPAGIRAEEVVNARMSAYEADLYDKFIIAGRFHASFNIIGTLSSRMSGSDGLNAQGVKKTKEVRSNFPLAFPGYVLSIGDFAGFEVTLAEACYNDKNLRKQLLTCESCENQMKHVRDSVSAKTFLDKEGVERYVKWRSKKEKNKSPDEIAEEIFENDFYCTSCGSTKGKKIHALFGVHVFPEHDYYSLKATEGTKDDKYTKAKSGIFAMMYGGTEYTLKERLGVPEEVALAALAKFHREFPGIKRAQLDVINKLCSMQQVGGIGTKVTWREPEDYIESMFGFRRNFTLENKICKALFELANSPPKEWQAIKIRVQRRERMQTVSGALQSALYGAAFGLQASNTRAGINHIIQSSGATITKDVQCAIWEIQPVGVHEFNVIPMNIHDEIGCPTKPEYVDTVAKIVKEKTESFRSKVPLIKIDWVKKANSWAEKS